MKKKGVSKMLDNYVKPKIISPSFQIDGFARGSSVKGDPIEVIQKGVFTSLDREFHTYAREILRISESGGAWNLLIKINELQTEVYADNLPITLEVRAKRNLKKMSAVYLKDLADISEVNFKDAVVNLNPVAGDKVIVILSFQYLHGLYFDLTGMLDPVNTQKELGGLYRRLVYSDLYIVLSNGSIDQMMEVGWFPFVRTIGGEFEAIVSLVTSGKLDKVGAIMNSEFTNERIAEIVEFWQTFSSFHGKKELIRQGIDCFYNGSYGASISTLAPLVEGIFNDYLLQKTGKGVSYKGDEIAKEIHGAARVKVDGESLLLPDKFKEYLVKYYFQHNKSATSDIATRNVVRSPSAEEIEADHEDAQNASREEILRG